MTASYMWSAWRGNAPGGFPSPVVLCLSARQPWPNVGNESFREHRKKMSTRQP